MLFAVLFSFSSFAVSYASFDFQGEVGDKSSVGGCDDDDCDLDDGDDDGCDFDDSDDFGACTNRQLSKGKITLCKDTGCPKIGIVADCKKSKHLDKFLAKGFTLPDTFFADTDGDGFGDPKDFVVGCEAPEGYVDNSEDCDDTNIAINPGAEEVCYDEVDNNCNLQVDEDCVDCKLEGEKLILQGSVVKEIIGFCPNSAQLSQTCDCPDNHVAVGYQGLGGPGYGPAIVNSFQFICRELNSDGTLGAATTLTCSNGTPPTSGSVPLGPVFASNNDALVGVDLTIGCAIDTFIGLSNSVTNINDSQSNSINNELVQIGSGPNPTGGLLLVPDGHVVIGMETFVDPNPPFGSGSQPDISAGIRLRYQRLSCD